MKVIFYAREANGAAQRLRTVIESVVPKEDIESCRGIEGLSPKLYRSRDNMNIAVLLAGSKQELGKIVSIRNILADVRIILILPDRRKATIAKGHRLYPRFLSYADSDFRDVGVVLGRMLAGSNRFRGGGQEHVKNTH